MRAFSIIPARVAMSNIQELLSQARRSVAARDMAGATLHYRKVLESDENAEALLHLSNVEARSDHYRSGRDLALRALAAAAGKPALAPSEPTTAEGAIPQWISIAIGQSWSIRKASAWAPR